MKDERRLDVEGQTVICIASGPSLTEADCELARQSGLTCIVTNTTFRRCPWASAMLGHDVKWWKEYGQEVLEVFHGKLFACCGTGKLYGAVNLVNELWFQPFHNSGADAISLAVAGKARRVLMVGYDCTAKDGKIHWHEDHPNGMSNAKSIKTWPTIFKQLARYAELKGTEVINCSRHTVLDCFPRKTLSECI